MRKCTDETIECKFVNNDNDFVRFSEITMESLNRHVPYKKKYVRRNQMLFCEFVHNAFNGSIKSFKFPSILKLADIIPICKEGKEMRKKVTGQ